MMKEDDSPMSSTITNEMKLVLIGPPGSGKGTQAERLRDHFNIPHISSGNVLRSHVARGTDLGKKIKSFMDRGEIGPVELITEAILTYIKDNCPAGFILDGFPRTIYQAEKLAELFSIDAALFISVPDEIILERITGRLTCSTCSAIFHRTYKKPAHENICDLCGGDLIQRSDDNEATVINRIRVYTEDTKPVIDYYTRSGELNVIDATGSPDEIYEKIVRILS